MENLYEKTKKLCQQNNITPTRAKGQNFLINEDVYDKIISASNLDLNDSVLEVGPGLGFLTEKLAENAGNVAAVELDDKLADFLKMKLGEKGIRNVEVLNEDILEISNYQFSIFKQFSIINESIPQQGPKNYKIVANLPYNITSFFLRKFLVNPVIRPNMMVLMLQKEVAERIVAKLPKMSLLAVSVQFYAETEIIAYVPKEDFWPKPEVDSAILRINTKKTNNNEINEEYRKKFFQLVKIGFSAKRKMLKNNLSAGLHLSMEEVVKKLKQANFSEKIRAQELSLEDWKRLFSKFN